MFMGITRYPYVTPVFLQRPLTHEIAPTKLYGAPPPTFGVIDDEAFHRALTLGVIDDEAFHPWSTWKKTSG